MSCFYIEDDKSSFMLSPQDDGLRGNQKGEEY